MTVKAIYRVVDRTSSWFGRDGMFVAIRGEFIKLRFITHDRWGQTETAWHFDPSQVELVESLNDGE